MPKLSSEALTQPQGHEQTQGSVWDFRPALLTSYFLVSRASFYFCQQGPFPAGLL